MLVQKVDLNFSCFYEDAKIWSLTGIEPGSPAWKAANITSTQQMAWFLVNSQFIECKKTLRIFLYIFRILERKFSVHLIIHNMN